MVFSYGRICLLLKYNHSCLICSCMFADPASVPAGCTVCAWCQKVASNKQLFSLKTPTGQKAFCSEVCFTQCRRANFKRNKTCDWCRHVRHTVNYVDFQDGEHQLQFCRCDRLKAKDTWV